MPTPRTIRHHVIVDGSNIATEGRTLPSLAQLDEAVRAFLEEFPDTTITVVVDATFQHRIEAPERDAYEEAVLAGEIVSPPAGAVGRGDAFIAAVAQKADATILSNDSFQELHGEYPWMFDEGRIIGGKPVDGVGWVFVARTPVRGSISRRSQRDARSKPKGAKGGKVDKDAAAKAVEAEVKARRAASGAPGAAVEPASDTRGKAKGRGRGKGGRGAGADAAPDVVADAPAKPKRTRKKAAAAPVEEPTAADAPDDGGSGGGRGRRRRSGSKAPEAVNEPQRFLAFVSTHPVGSEVEAVVDRFSSHGAYVVVDGAQCYVPLRAMADPPPRSAREVLSIGESRTFVVESFDSPRRSIDLAVPGLLQVTGSSVREPDTSQEDTDMAPAKKAAAKKAPAKKAAAKKAPAKKAAAKKAAAKKAPAKKAPAKKAAAKKAPAKKAAAKKAPAKKAAAKKRA